MAVFSTIRDMKHSPFGLEQNAEMDCKRLQMNQFYLCNDIRSKKSFSETITLDVSLQANEFKKG